MQKYDLDTYLAAVDRTPPLSREQEVEVATRAAKGDNKARDLLVVSNLRFVMRVAHEYDRYGFSFPELLQEGTMGLIVAVDRYDYTKGYRLISYAVWWIRAYIQNFIMRTWSLVKLGSTQAQRKLFFKLRSAREQLDKVAHNFVADNEDIAKALHVRAKDVASMELRLNFRDADFTEFLHSDNPFLHEGPAFEDEIIDAQRNDVLHARLRPFRRKLTQLERHILDKRLMAKATPESHTSISLKFNCGRETIRKVEKLLKQKMRVALQEFSDVP